MTPALIRGWNERRASNGAVAPCFAPHFLKVLSVEPLPEGDWSEEKIKKIFFFQRRASNGAVAPCFAPISFGERLFAPRRGLERR